MKILVHQIRRTLVSAYLFFQDVALLCLTFWFSFWLRFQSQLPWFRKVGIPDPSSYWIASVVALYVVIAQLATSGLYSWYRLRSWREDFYKIIRSVSLAALLVLALGFFYRKIQYSRQLVLSAWFMAAVSLILGRLIFQGGLTLLRNHGYNVRRVLFLGHGSMVSVIIEKITARKPFGLSIEGYVDPKPATEMEQTALRYLGRPEEFAAFIRDLKINLVFCVDENLRHEQLLEFIEICEEANVELLLVPQIHDLLIDFSSLREVDGLPMVELREEPIHWGNLFAKRCLDLFLASSGIVLSLPLQILVAFWIRFDSPGPILFSQIRVGYRGKKFRMWKFRTMVEDAEKRLHQMLDMNDMKEPVFKIKNDPRVTRPGRFLRRMSLDELPQLYNVLLGQMSLVGPRPEEEEMVRRYNVWQRRRLKVKPGITGLQQIKCRGSLSLSQRVKFDIYYIRKLNVLLDLEILTRTIWVVLAQKGAS